MQVAMVLGRPRNAGTVERGEHLDELRVELDAGLAAQLGDRRLVARWRPGTGGRRSSPRRRRRSTRCARRSGSPRRPGRAGSRGRRTTRGGGARSSPRRAGRPPARGRPGRSWDARRPPATRTRRGRRAWRGSRRGSRACRGRGAGSPSGCDPARPPAGRSRGPSRPTPRRSAWTACRPTTARPASVRSSASWAAAIAARPTSSALRAGLGADRRAADRVLVAGLAEHVDLVATERLGGVQRGVGVAHQRVEPQHVARPAGHAGGQGDRDDARRQAAGRRCRRRCGAASRPATPRRPRPSPAGRPGTPRRRTGRRGPRRARCSARSCATCRSTTSPAAWPWVSLRRLKWSRSTRITDSGRR